MIGEQELAQLFDENGVLPGEYGINFSELPTYPFYMELTVREAPWAFAHCDLGYYLGPVSSFPAYIQAPIKLENSR